MRGKINAIAAIVRTVRDAVSGTGELLRLATFLLLGLAAKWLPASWAMKAVNLVGAAMAHSPAGCAARRSMLACFAGEPAQAERAAREWLERPFRDYAWASRVCAGRADVRQVTVDSRGAPALLDDPNQSLIIATGHFARQAMTGFYAPGVVSKRITTVIAPIDRRSRPKAVRLRLQTGAMFEGIGIARDGDARFVEVGGAAAVVNLVNCLKQPGSAVIINTDAPWPAGKPGRHVRPFAGHAARSFATGSVWLSRLSQTPIVPCVPFLDEEGRIVLEWGELIPPPPRHDASADVRLTDVILDVIERAIGQRPGQYVLAVGRERQWRASAQCWSAIAESEVKLRASLDEAGLADVGA